MSAEPKKISFGFNKVSKKNNLIQAHKDSEVKNDIQFIDCLEGKSIKLIGGEKKEKEPPVIPMRNGNLLKESMREVAKLRGQNKREQDLQGNVTSKEDSDTLQKTLTLDELATKEILEDLKKSNDNKKEVHNSVVSLTTQSAIQDKESTLEDYENMPITDFGLAMLRGMGWDPKKGIGLNEKIVTPLTQSLRPKGMGLGADKAPTTQNVTSNGELLIMKKGAPIKVVSGPHNNLYGKIEGFDELPGRLVVRIAESSVLVSLNEIMVKLVSSSEYNKNFITDIAQPLGTERHDPPKDQALDQVLEKSRVKNEKTLHSSSFDAGNSELKSSDYSRNTKDQLNLMYEVNGKELPTKNARKNEKSPSRDSDNVENIKYIKKRRNKERRSRSNSSSISSSSYKEVRRPHEKKKQLKSRHGDYYQDRKYSKKSYSSYERHRRKSRSSRRDKYASSSSSDSDKDFIVKSSKKGKRSASTDSRTCSNSFRKSHSRKHKKHYYKR